MKRLIALTLAVALSACAPVNFVGDAPAIEVTSETPDRFELPARFAFARTVNGTVAAAGAREAKLWADLADQSQSLGTFTPLVSGETQRYRTRNHWRQIDERRDVLIDAARAQRYTYLILVAMNSSTGTADISLLHVASGGVMATAQATSPEGGRSGFWGNGLNNPKRLERQTLRIARAARPVLAEMLQGVAQRSTRPQHEPAS
ncbi:MAG: hypothetical protein AAGA87_15970 [Pseudomonadota bacterium]